MNAGGEAYLQRLYVRVYAVWACTASLRAEYWFGELIDKNIFNTVHIAGLSVEWVNGQDVCPDDLYYSSIPL